MAKSRNDVGGERSLGKVLLVHLSDVHTKSDEDPVLGRADLIAAAVQDLELDLDAAVIVLTGDLAHSGLEAQYLSVWSFLEELRESLGCRLSGMDCGQKVPVSIIAVPGNHDCDFSGSTDIRSIVISQILRDSSQADVPAVIGTCVEVQANFFDALLAFGTPTDSPIHEAVHRLRYTYTIPVGAESITFLCFNSAWMSQIHEQQGSLYLSESLVPTQRPDGSIVAAMFHHPYNWYPADSARALRRRVEAVADLILTGHEHEATARVQRAATGERNTIIEGGALQQSASPEASAFNAFILDLTHRKQKKARFEWDGVRYIPLGRTDSTGGVFGADWEELQVTRLRERGSFELSHDMRSMLDDLGMPLVHKQRGVLKLSDVFVYPDLQEIIQPDSSVVRVVQGSKVSRLILDSSHLLILGESESGKTSLAKQAFRYLLDNGYIPILLDGAKRPKTGDDFVSYVTDIFASQYNQQARQVYLQLDRSSRVVIIDDYEKLPLNGERKRQFLQRVAQFSGRVMLLANGLVQDANDLISPAERADSVVPFAKYRIMPMGRLLRNDLVEKWMLLDENAEKEAARYAYRREELTRTLDFLTANNRLPRYPLFILTILQGTEIVATMDTQVGTHGAYYELIIRGALGRSRAPEQFNLIVGYLSHFAYHLFDAHRRAVDLAQFRAIHRDYEAAYDLDFAVEHTIRDLVRDQILDDSEGHIRFKHKFVFYYFVAIWLRDHMREDRVRERIKQLTQSVFIEEYANILMFLAHVSRDPLIIDEVLAAAQSLIPDIAPASLIEEVRFLDLHKSEDRERVFVDGNEHENRRRMLGQLDERGRQFEEDPLPDDELPPLNVQDEANVDPVVEIVAASKTLEILGQILKSFPGNLVAEQKLDIARECYFLGLRSLTLVYDWLHFGQDEMLAELVSIARASDTSLTQLQAQQRARNLMLGLAEALAAVFVRFVSSAIGSPNLDRTYTRLEEESDLLPVHLINASIRMDFAADFPETRVIELGRMFADVPFARAVLQNLVVMHFHLFPTPISTKQRVCQALGIRYSQTMGANPHLQAIA